MKNFYLFLLSFVFVYSQDINQTSINNFSYEIVYSTYNEYGDKGTEMMFYRKNQNHDELPLFTFTLENQSGGCSEKSIQAGAYDINGSKLTFYTHWDRVGKAYASPQGDRIQHYEVDNNGTVHFIDGLLYIETEAKNYDTQSDIQFLFNIPKTLEEKQKLKEYIKRVEQTFKGHFVRDKEADTLHQKVDKALMEKRKTRWK